MASATIPILSAARDLPAEPGLVLVPTMGALHDGHLALVEHARAHAGSAPVVVSVFVNPAQFDERGDFDAYPRDVERDAELARAAGASHVFAPAVDEIYPGGPGGRELRRPVGLPEVARDRGLEDAYRPGHFEGVYRVCRRLFELVRPAAATFGEKDWQQLRLAAALVEQEGLDVAILPVPTVREPDGLAMSSRNVHLRPADRAAALGLVQGIRAAQAQAEPAVAEHAAVAAIASAGARLEYAAVREATTLGSVEPGRPARVLVAARVGGTRLIDNDAWPTSG